MTTQEQQKPKKPAVARNSGGMDVVYGIGMIGAWIYYFQRATTPQQYGLALLKGFAWPALLVYTLLKFLEKD